MKKFYRALFGMLLYIVIGLFIVPSQCQAFFGLFESSTIAGSVSGDFDVSDNGAASYKIDIEVPPGTSQMEPKLSFTYNSQNQDGLMGRGWDVSGLSSVARCPKTIAQDGVKAGVSYSSNDRFCVDGQRLMAVNSVAYGADGTEYYTEKNQWNRYYSKGQCGTGPCYFIGQTPEGFTLEYGNTTDSRILASGKSEVRVWAVNKKTDKNSNFMTVSYVNNTDSGSYYPDTLNYTGNVLKGFQTQRSVNFSYEDRPDTSESYLAGSKVTKLKRLSKVKTYVDDGLVKTYNVSYEISPITGRSLVTSLQECGMDESCFTPTTFDWDNNLSIGNSFNMQNWGNQLSWTDDSTANAGDYNADGLSDVVYAYNNSGKMSIAAFISTGSSFAQTSWYTGSNSWENGSFLPGDYNGDGVSDLAYSYNNSGNVIVDLYLSTRSSFNRVTGNKTNLNWANDTRFETGDFNGDGLADLAAIYNKSGKIGVDVLISTGQILVLTDSFSVSSDKWSNDGTVSVGDYNGDGITDLIYAYNDSGSLGVLRYISTGKVFLKNNWSDPTISWTDDKLFGFSDYNGDGLTDVSFFFNDSGHISAKVLLSSGDGFSAQSWSQTDVVWGGQKIIKSGDYNGDGLTDVSYVYRDNNHHISMRTYLSTGAAFIHTDSLSGQGSWSNETFIPSDYTGNGIADIANLFNDSGKVSFHVYSSVQGAEETHVLSQSDLLTDITTGLKGKTSIVYKPLTDATVYSKGTSGVSFPIVNVSIPNYVVSSYEERDPVSNTKSSFSYFYKSAQIDVQGRGWLGFAEVSKKDLSSPDTSLQTETVTSYFQAFPLTGIANTHVVTRISDTAILNKSTNDYGSVLSPLSSSNQSIYMVYKKSSTSDVYTEGTYNYSLIDSYVYDLDYKYIVQINKLDSDDSGNHYVCFDFGDSDMGDAWWHEFLPVAKKVTSTLAGCTNPDFTKWVASTDLRFYRFDYDGNMNIINHKTWDDSSNQWIEKKQDHDAYGNVISKTNPAGNVTKVDFDSTYHTFPVTVTMPLTQSMNTPLSKTAVYEPNFGRITQQTDYNGNVVMQIPTNGLDAFGRVINQLSIQPDRTDLVSVAVRSFAAGDKGGLDVTSQQRVDWADVTGNGWYWKKASYDATGRVYRKDNKGPTDSQNISSLTSYDDRGLTLQKSLKFYSNELPEYISYLYDVNKNMIQSTLPDGTISKIIYDLSDNRIVTSSTPNPANQSNTDSFINIIKTKDNFGNIVLTVDANQGKTISVYDVLSQNISMTDPLGSSTTYSYNSLGQMTKVSNPDTGTVQYSFYNTGDVEKVTDALGQTQNFTYDALGRVLQEKRLFADGSLDKIVTYTYDSAENGKGLKASISTPDVTYKYAYDLLGNVKQKTTKISNLPESYVETYSYDALKHMVKTDLPDVSSVIYSYGQDGLLSEVGFKVASSSDIITMASYENYTALGKYTKIAFANGVETDLTYDILGRMQTSKTVHGNNILRNYTYGWNRAAKILNIEDVRVHPSINFSQDFTYDEMGYLSKASSLYGKMDYGYNLTGDITSFNQTTYNYSSTKKHQMISSSDGTSLAYDDKGNMSSKISSDNQTTYSYDVLGNLISVQNSTITDKMRFAYDDHWQRVWHKKADGAAIYYISPSYVVTCETPSSCNVMRYVYGDGRVVASISPTNDMRYYHSNNIGSTTLITDLNATETDYVTYLPFGSIDEEHSNIKEDFLQKFSGKELDKSGLYYFGARYYDPDLRRFTTPDPAKQFASPYIYVANDPIKNTDPDGRVVGIDDAIELAVIAEVAADTAVEAAAATAATSTAVEAGTTATAAMIGVVETDVEVTSVASVASLSSTGAGIVAAQPELTASISASDIVVGSSTAESSEGIATSSGLEASDFAESDFSDSIMEEDGVSSSDRGYDRPGNSQRDYIRRRPRNDIRSHDLYTHRVYSSTGIVNSEGVESMVVDTSSYDDTLIFSGSHGDEFGDTVIENSRLGRDTVRFFDEDRLTARSYRGRIDVQDLYYTSSRELDYAIQTGRFGGRQYNCVMLGFCYSEVRYNQVMQYASDARVGGRSVFP